MINKTVNTVQEALQGIESGMTIMFGGFGLCGIPENSISELVKNRLQILLAFRITQVLTILD
jgi:3-oxoacid CoA-transferase subunit A